MPKYDPKKMQELERIFDDQHVRETALQWAQCIHYNDNPLVAKIDKDCLTRAQLTEGSKGIEGIWVQVWVYVPKEMLAEEEIPFG